jgi:hypothetical protein
LSPQIHYIKAIRAELPDDGFVVGESTQLAYAVRVAMPFYRPRTYVTHGYQGTLGYGFPTALGVRLPSDKGLYDNRRRRFSAWASNPPSRVSIATVTRSSTTPRKRQTPQIQKYGGR